MDYQEKIIFCLIIDVNVSEVDILGCRINSFSLRSVSFGFTIQSILVITNPRPSSFCSSSEDEGKSEGKGEGEGEIGKIPVLDK
ncbi:unnamed protein product [Rhizophagus irregularis]|nr:unnamed protein product [Rhizophagus irregularis]